MHVSFYFKFGENRIFLQKVKTNFVLISHNQVFNLLWIYYIQLKPVNQDSFKGDFLLIDMLFWEHFLYNAM